METVKRFARKVVNLPRNTIALGSTLVKTNKNNTEARLANNRADDIRLARNYKGVDLSGKDSSDPAFRAVTAGNDARGTQERVTKTRYARSDGSSLVKKTTMKVY